MSKSEGGVEIPAETIAAMGGGAAAAGYSDPYAQAGGYYDAYGNWISYPASQPASGNPGMQPGMQVKPGDWRCPSCSNVK